MIGAIFEELIRNFNERAKQKSQRFTSHGVACLMVNEFK